MVKLLNLLHNLIIVTLCSVLTTAVIIGLSMVIWLLIGAG